VFSRSFFFYPLFVYVPEETEGGKRKERKEERGKRKEVAPCWFSLLASLSRLLFFFVPPLSSRTDTLQRTPMSTPTHQPTISKQKKHRL
jgi:hypothetical protein